MAQTISRMASSSSTKRIRSGIAVQSILSAILAVSSCTESNHHGPKTHHLQGRAWYSGAGHGYVRQCLTQDERFPLVDLEYRTARARPVASRGVGAARHVRCFVAGSFGPAGTLSSHLDFGLGAADSLACGGAA